MSSVDLDYYRRRAEAERALAKESGRTSVAAIHEELAQQYEALLQYEELRLASKTVVRVGQLA